MDTNFIEVVDQAQIEKLALTAREIWYEYFPKIISIEQIEYMLEKFQSVNAISKQISDNHYKYFMMLCDEEAIGYFSIKEEQESLFLSKLYLKKASRGKGYFNVMLSFIERFAKDMNLNSMYLLVNKHNEQAIRVYQKKGFFVSKEQITDVGNGFVLDDYVMEKKL